MFAADSERRRLLLVPRIQCLYHCRTKRHLSHWKGDLYYTCTLGVLDLVS